MVWWNWGAVTTLRFVQKRFVPLIPQQSSSGNILFIKEWRFTHFTFYLFVVTNNIMELLWNKLVHLFSCVITAVNSYSLTSHTFLLCLLMRQTKCCCDVTEKSSWRRSCYNFTYKVAIRRLLQMLRKHLYIRLCRRSALQVPRNELLL